MARRGALAEHFDDLAQQREAGTLGMWAFLATELLLFGGLFLGYAVYRTHYPEAWAEGGRHDDVLLGTINTGILLVSSLTMALAVHAAEEARWKVAARFLLGTLALGVVFLGIKFYEYGVHYRDGLAPGVRFDLGAVSHPEVELFMFFYFAMTGLHALHMTVGLGVVAVMAWRAHRRSLAYGFPVEAAGLYWHFVDVIWVFLYPLFYLVR